MKKYKYILIVGLLLVGTVAIAAPSNTFERTLLPETTSTYDLGSAAKVWDTLYVNNCVGTGCGGGGGSAVGGGQWTYATVTSKLWSGLVNASSTDDEVGVGTTSPFAKFSIHGNASNWIDTLFAVGSSTDSATSTLFKIEASGDISTVGWDINSLFIDSTDADGPRLRGTGGSHTVPSFIPDKAVSTSGLGGKDNNVTLISSGRITIFTDDALAPTAAPLSAMDDGTSQKVNISGAVGTQADYALEVDYDGDGSLTDLGMRFGSLGLEVLGAKLRAPGMYSGEDGSNATPAISYVGDPGTGVWWEDEISFNQSVNARWIYSARDDLTTSASVLTCGDDGTSGTCTVQGGAGQVANVFEVDADGDGFEDFLIDQNGKVGIGTTTPYARLSVHGDSQNYTDTLFAVGSSTASATSTLFKIEPDGDVFIEKGILYVGERGTTNGNYLSIDPYAIESQNLVQFNVRDAGAGATAINAGYRFSGQNSGTTRHILNMTPTQGIKMITQTGAANVAQVKNEQATLTNPVFVPDIDDGDTGLGGDVSNTLSLIAGGVNVLQVDNDGTSNNVTIAGSASQASDLLVIEDSGGTDDFTVQADGDVIVGTARLLFPNGAIGAPALAPLNEPDVGFAYNGGGGLYSVSASRVIIEFDDDLTHGGAVLSAGDDGSAHQVNIKGGATQGSNAIFNVEDTSGFDWMTIDASGLIGVASSSPYARLSVHGDSQNYTDTLFAVGSSTASATSTLFKVEAGGDVTVGTGQLLVPAGSYAAPQIALASDTDTGWFLSGTNMIFGASGVREVLLSPNQVIAGAGATGDGRLASVDSPTQHSFNGDTDTGLDWNAADSFYVDAGGQAVAYFADTLTPAAAPLSAMDDGTSHQVLIQGAAAQASDLLVIENSGGADLVTVQSAGSLNIGTTAAEVENSLVINKAGSDSTRAIWFNSPSSNTDWYFNYEGDEDLNLTKDGTFANKFIIQSDDGIGFLISTATAVEGVNIVRDADATKLTVRADATQDMDIFTVEQESKFAWLKVDQNGLVGVASSSPYARLSVHGDSQNWTDTLFAIGSSTPTATTTLFSVDSNGDAILLGSLRQDPDQLSMYATSTQAIPTGANSWMPVSFEVLADSDGEFSGVTIPVGSPVASTTLSYTSHYEINVDMWADRSGGASQLIEAAVFVNNVIVKDDSVGNDCTTERVAATQDQTGFFEMHCVASFTAGDIITLKAISSGSTAEFIRNGTAIPNAATVRMVVERTD